MKMVFAKPASGISTMSDNLIFTDEKYFEERGNLYTIYDQRYMPENCRFVQDKITRSHQGVVRGFHGDDKTWKLITCLYGKIKLITFDVDTEKKNVYILDGDDPVSRSVLVAPRVLNAHQCLTDECIFYYKWSEYYTGAKDQWSVYYNDEVINPQWDDTYPIIVSDRDQKSKSLEELKRNVAS